MVPCCAATSPSSSSSASARSSAPPSRCSTGSSAASRCAARATKADPYECGLPSEVSRTFRFGVSFYMVAMLFILFDIEVVFLYPVGVIINAADSVFVLVEVLVFVVLLLVALIYVWRRGALDWR